MGLLDIIIIVLVIGWVTGSIALPSASAWLSILLAVAVILVVVRLARGENILR